jgi:hypothetical protein
MRGGKSLRFSDYLKKLVILTKYLHCNVNWRACTRLSQEGQN